LSQLAFFELKGHHTEFLIQWGGTVDSPIPVHGQNSILPPHPHHITHGAIVCSSHFPQMGPAVHTSICCLGSTEIDCSRMGLPSHAQSGPHNRCFLQPSRPRHGTAEGHCRYARRVSFRLAWTPRARKDLVLCDRRHRATGLYRGAGRNNATQVESPGTRT